MTGIPDGIEGDLEEARRYAEDLYQRYARNCEHCKGNPMVKECTCPQRPPWMEPPWPDE